MQIRKARSWSAPPHVNATQSIVSSCPSRNKQNFVQREYGFLASSQNYEKRLLASSCESDRMKQVGSHWTNFHEICHLSTFRKPLAETEVLLNSDNNNGYFTRRTPDIFDHISLSSSKNEKRFRQKLWRKSREILYSVTVFRKSCCSWDNVEKVCRAGQVIADNMAHAHCVLDT